MSENNVLVIFGSTGDLTYQKLLPALDRLVTLYPDRLQKVILIGRQVETLDAYLSYGDDHGLERQRITHLLPKLTYHYMQAGEAHQYPSLATLIQPFSNRFFYLATPPSMFAIITEALAKCGCLKKGHPHHRCAFEKPFGENGTTATVLNELLHEHLEESQLYRVDHYLAKPIIQAMLKIRMQWEKVGMEKYWHKDAISHITIRAYETVSILSRGKFYDATGALKDMIQSHLLETLALVTMDLPQRLDDVLTIQNYKTQLLSSLQPLDDAIRFGQYQGYLAEDHVNPNSLTETFVHLPLRIQSPRWHGVKVTLTTGKKLSEKRTEIVIHFRQGGYLTFQISPIVKLIFSDTLLATFPQSISQHLLTLSKHPFMQEDAYVIVFKDFFDGNQTLFPSSQEIIATWQLIDHIKNTPRLPIPYRHEDDVLSLEGNVNNAPLS
jgi:glucose-6-phosphate 1-dehydrogenase